MEPDFRTKYQKLLKAVEITRDSQKKFFQYKNESNLKQAKKFEKQLDDFVKTELKDLESGQQKMF